jgi:methylmalonyl-CoA/ethylmalonyl-CoA epimerase
MPSETASLPRGVRQIAYVVHDLPVAVRFWRDTLGARLLFEAPPGLAFFDLGGLRLMLTGPDKPEFDHPNSILFLAVDDIRAVHATLVARSVAFVDEPHCVAKLPHAEVWVTSFRDPEGNLLALMAEVPVARG